MLQTASGKALPELRVQDSASHHSNTPQARRAEYCRAALRCLKDGHRIAAESLYERAAIENQYALGRLQ